jgi:hypothetical protein
MATLTIIDYILVHELADLLYPNRTPELEPSGRVDAGLPGTQGVAAEECGEDGYVKMRGFLCVLGPLVSWIPPIFEPVIQMSGAKIQSFIGRSRRP